MGTVMSIPIRTAGVVGRIPGPPLCVAVIAPIVLFSAVLIGANTVGVTLHRMHLMPGTMLMAQLTTGLRTVGMIHRAVVVDTMHMIFLASRRSTVLMVHDAVVMNTVLMIHLAVPLLAMIVILQAADMNTMLVDKRTIFTSTMLMIQNTPGRSNSSDLLSESSSRKDPRHEGQNQSSGQNPEKKFHL